MSIYRRVARHDVSHAEVVGALRAHGCTVQAISAAGVPDLLVGWRGLNFLVEVKAPLGPRGGRSHRTLNPLQQSWAAAWRGDKPWTLRSAAEVAEWIQARRDELEVETYCTRCERLVAWVDYPQHKAGHLKLVPEAT